MAVTPNLNLYKPDEEDYVSIARDLNENYEKIDAAFGSHSDAIANLQSGLAYIVGNTNATGVSLAVGQYVYVKGHSTIPEGLRKVKGSSAIGNGGSITTNNTEAVSEGGLNALNSNITADTQITSCTSDDITINGHTGYYKRTDHLVTFAIKINYTSNTSAAVGIKTSLPNAYLDMSALYGKIDTDVEVLAQMRSSTGRIRISSLSTGTHDLYVFGTYIC